MDNKENKHTYKMDSFTVGTLLKQLLHDRSLSLRKFSKLTDIDPATMSRIINGKRKANLQHLEKFASCLNVPLIELIETAGHSAAREKTVEPKSDVKVSVESIQNILNTFNLDYELTVDTINQHLLSYQDFSQTKEGKDTILNEFDEKMEKTGHIGPFISQLKELFAKFRQKKGTKFELAIMGSALLYFIIPVDIIPDYIFTVGYLDDAVVVQITMQSLSK